MTVLRIFCRLCHVRMENKLYFCGRYDLPGTVAQTCAEV